MVSVESLKSTYPGSIAWSFGDSVIMADELAELVAKGRKTASCGSLDSFISESPSPNVGSYHIILNGQQLPVCVIRLISLRIVKFCDVDETFARKVVYAFMFREIAIFGRLASCFAQVRFRGWQIHAASGNRFFLIRRQAWHILEGILKRPFDRFLPDLVET